MKEKTDEFGYIKTKTIYSLEYMKGGRRQAVDQESSGNTLSWFITRIYREIYVKKKNKGLEQWHRG